MRKGPRIVIPVPKEPTPSTWPFGAYVEVTAETCPGCQQQKVLFGHPVCKQCTKAAKK